MDSAGSIRDALRDFSLTLPEAYEDFPWGERVTKVNKKIFVFLGADGEAERRTIGLKLGESHPHALSLPGVVPSGYGLGRAGWVTIPLTNVNLPVEVLREWVEESYRLVAPKRLVARLDQGRTLGA
jgi:predicted DNA-binding protein (MmcQ/YjbR family)